jgi:PAS domain S-box-containing protein
MNYVNNKKRLLYLILNLATVSTVVAGTTIMVLYQTAFDQQRERLMETAQSQARLIESVARFNTIYIREEFEGGPTQATLNQVIDAHRHFKGFGQTGEIVLARLEKDNIMFLLNHRHFDMDNPKPVPLNSKNAEPMRRALKGLSGTSVEFDYRGIKVLAAYEPVAVLGYGIVAKIDLAEIRAPFIKAAYVTAIAALVVIATGTAVFLFLINPFFVNLQESENKYRQLFDSAADMIFLHEPLTGKLVDVNPAACRLLGRKREELIGKDYFTLLASEDLTEELKRLIASSRAGDTASTVAPLSRLDGTKVETELRLMPVTIKNQDLILCIGRDLTAQHQLERRSLAFYQAFRNSNDFMFYTDQNGIIQDVNNAFIRRFGFRRDEAVGRTPRIIRSPLTSDELYGKLWKDIMDTSKGFWRGRLSNRAKDGEEIPVLLSITAVRNDNFETIGFVSSAVDLTEQEALQKRLTQSESLAAVGSMAAVVAHEIRNPLGSIVTAAGSISRHDLPPEDQETLLRVIREESQRLNNTLTQFLQYARPRNPQLEISDLNKSVDELISMVRSDPETLGKIEIDLDLDKNLKPFKFDNEQMRQVLWNVVINALHAMKGEGQLIIKTWSSEGSARLDISDTGPGIPEQEVEKIFQPFHTTKQKGTGLGLPVAERIISSHGGSILVKQPPKGGCCFAIALPLHQEDV